MGLLVIRRHGRYHWVMNGMSMMQYVASAMVLTVVIGAAITLDWKPELVPVLRRQLWVPVGTVLQVTYVLLGMLIGLAAWIACPFSERARIYHQSRVWVGQHHAMA